MKYTIHGMVIKPAQVPGRGFELINPFANELTESIKFFK